ncbi:hypothetical protein Ahy_A04g020640 [Arachis hypogaea]|uniref:Pentatricopeptide repeat-containing protein n=1 Tax=Arachis hypogaea TaxID=3818 RepID=A0A445DI51_ARAHY|nr:hypothetical protein Ahy_A04g020640 [Arachis hypogaea]
MNTESNISNHPVYKILEYNVIQDFFSRNILLNYISKRQNMAVAKQLLSSMITRGLVSDVYTYETIIARYCKLGNTNDILQKYIVDELQKRRLFDTTSFNTLISGYYTELEIFANRVTCNKLINLLCKCGSRKKKKN